ncbi:MAG: hypothetical protein DWQ37_12785 [Planctomycetota bacterium]|nr:MAG: hypothetical protein DWQ37_12785 [Planctomycetota bacterium]
MFARTALILTVLCLPGAVRAEGVVRDGFDGPETRLLPAGGDARHTVELHDCTDAGVHSAPRCEQLRISGGGGTAVYYSYPIQPARVISELTASVWVRSDRPGPQIIVRIVFPRSKHPRTGEPLTTLVRGSSYNDVGSWQMLRIEGLPAALANQTRVLRSQFGPQVDPREAYIDLVLLNVYGGPGTTNLWVDDLEITGGVSPGSVSASNVAFASQATDPVSSSSPPASVMPEVELRGRLSVGGEPFFPRIIEHRGESLAHLQSLGFNCVYTSAPPTPAMLNDAARLRLWLIAPPPPASELRARDGQQRGTEIGPEYDPVLAWDLGRGLSERELPAVRQRAEQVRWADPRDRPIVVSADADLDGYSRPPFSVLLDRRTVLGTSLELSQYADWLSQRGQMARAGATLWATIPTQVESDLLEQMRLLSGRALPPPSWQEAQLRAVARAALSARARGLFFTSQTRLDAPDPATQARAAMLGLLNLELQLIDRWPSAGNFSMSADTSNRPTAGAVMETELSRLLLPIYAPGGGQFVLGTQAAPRTSYVVAGVPEGNRAFELTLTGLHPIRGTRVTGGTRVVLDDQSRDSMVVFTQDPHVTKKLKEGVEATRGPALQLIGALAAAEKARIDSTVARLGQFGRDVRVVPEARATVEQDLQKFAAQQRTSPDKAYRWARHALELLRQIERVYWEQAQGGLAEPLSATFDTLPAHYEFINRIAAAPRSGNRLPQGECENLTAMLSAGWRHYLHEQHGVRTGVELTPGAAHTGAAGLLLHAVAADEKRKPGVIETPPVWITTAGIAVESGDLVQIDAWVRIDAPITGSVDGLVILDTVTGAPLALRLTATKGWQQVTMYRAATRSGTMAVTFAMGGLGMAAIDDVSMQIVERSAAQQARR